MLDFIRRHWIAYVVGAVLAVALGAAAAYIVGVKGSTPAATKQERVAAERENMQFADSLDDSADQGSSQ